MFKDKRVIGVVVGVLFIALMVLIAIGTWDSTTAVTDEGAVMLSQTVQGFFGFLGEDSGIPSSLTLVRVDEYQRILMASSGASGENVIQAGCFSVASDIMSLSVWDINGDEYNDVMVGTLILYGSPEGLKVW